MSRLLASGAAALALALASAGCGPRDRSPVNPAGYSPEQIRRLNDNDAAFARCVADRSHSYNWCVDRSNETEQQIKEGQ